jgi:gamma-glutamylcyclotransferase
MHRYFAYGSNMLRARIEERLGPVEVLGAAVLAGYAHSFSKLGRDGTGKGNISQARDGEVHGVLYRLDAVQLTRLVEIEGGYRLISLSVRCSGQVVDAGAFQALAPMPALVPTAEYLAFYERGMHEHGLPAHYRAWILAQAGLRRQAS